MKSKHIFIALCCLIALHAQAQFAKLPPQGVVNNIAPANILFSLDTSGSGTQVLLMTTLLAPSFRLIPLLKTPIIPSSKLQIPTSRYIRLEAFFGLLVEQRRTLEEWAIRIVTSRRVEVSR